MKLNSPRKTAALLLLLSFLGAQCAKDTKDLFSCGDAISTVQGNNGTDFYKVLNTSDETIHGSVQFSDANGVVVAFDGGKTVINFEVGPDETQTIAVKNLPQGVFVAETNIENCPAEFETFNNPGFTGGADDRDDNANITIKAD